MAQNQRKNSVIVLDQELVKSKVWLSLTASAKDVFLIMRCRCKYAKVRHKGGKKTVMTNNGELIFPYREAVADFGFTVPRFMRSIDLLVETGFLDIAEHGNAALRQPTKYGISERWRKYGTDSFEKRKRTPSHKVGWLSSKKGMETP
jgi:hypothetical protein